MSSSRLQRIFATLAATTAIIAAPASAQGFQASQSDLSARRGGAGGSDSLDDAATRSFYSFDSRSDSLARARNRGAASKASGFRLVVSLQDRHLWAIIGRDTVLSAPVAVAK